MPHSRIQLSSDIAVPDQPHMVNGFFKAPHIHITRIIPAGQKQHRQLPVCAMPSMESIRLLQQIIQRKKSIIRKRKATERIFFILPHHLRVRTAPGKSALLVCKARCKRTKRHCLQKIAPMLVPEHRCFRVSHSRTQRPQIILAR